MIILGLTGSIGMGKSSAALMLKKLKVSVHDSDRAVHDALLPKGRGFEIVAVNFPEAWDKKNCVIDRTKLGAIVFKDSNALKKLENILHPIVQESQRDFIRSMQGKGQKIVCLEIPLLFETGAQERVDYTICVTAPPAIQRRRVMARKGMTAEKFKAILSHQMPDGEKCEAADFVVQTGLGYAHTFSQLKKILNEVRS